MKNPIFKRPEEPLSPLEEEEITKELADAYRQHELDEKRPEFRRIVENVETQLLKIDAKKNRQ
jgi:hypothetical protein